MTVTHADLTDLPALTTVEAACFPPAEAADEASFHARLTAYPDHFWLLREGDEVIAFVNGMVSDEPTIRDELYHDAALHNPHGAWQMIFGVNTLPAYRRRGCAACLLRCAIEEARVQGRRGLVLTCKKALIHYYAKFGFVCEGLSASTHGGAEWYDMRLTF